MTRAPHLESLEHTNADAVAPDEIRVGDGYPETGHPVSTPSDGTPDAEGAEETFVVPASLEQTRYWTLAQIDPGSTASNMAISCEIAGALDPLIVEQALAALTIRHEALRTLFRVVDGQLSQVILTRPLYEFTQQDLSSVSPASQPTALAAALSKHSHLAIDLEHGPVLRARLFALAPERYVLALTMNHIVCDGWSNGLMMRDLARIYHALRTGAGSLKEVAAGPAGNLPELPFQFADFTVWQNEYLASERAATALDFWTSHIPRELPALDMPADYPRQAGRSFPGTIASALLPPSVNQKLAAYCRTSGSTKHIVLLTIFEALCARFSGQRQFLLGSTIANRTQPGMEDVVGRFANPQIVVADVTGDPSFRDLELRVREWETSAYTHQDMPFSRVMEAFQTHQEGAGSQFLQVWFVYQRAFMQPQEIPGLTLTPLRSVSGGVDFDLLVSVVERAEGPRLQIEYNTDLFTGARIEGLLAAFQQMLTGALAHPEQPISQIEVGSAPSSLVETIASVDDTRQTATDNLLDTVTAHVLAQPAGIAVRAGSQALTWQQLAERAQALSAYLEHEAHLAGATTALVVLTPEVASAVALLALLQLGENGPHIVPLPAHTSGADLQLAASDSTLLLAPARFLHDTASSRTRSLAFEGIATLPGVDAATAADGSRTMPRHWAMPSTASFGTSTFSTEDISFADTMHSVSALAERLHLAPEDGLLSVAPASPADALFDHLLALHSGVTLDLTTYQSGVALQPILDAHQSSVVIAEPAQWRGWVADGWKGDRRLTAIARGRHVEHTGWLNDTTAVRSAVSLLSVHGNALATAVTRSADFVVLPDVAPSVLDAEGQHVPAGATGELTLVHRHATSRERTGYLVQTQGNTAHGFRVLGTISSVVHLRGHRIQLSDLDAALLRMPGVIDAVSILQQREDGISQIAAWVMGHGELDALELRQSLAATLPQHLVPSTLQIAHALPYRLDGSIDITALRPAPEPAAESALAIAEDSALATDDVSRELSDIWRETLNLSTIDPHASFFSAGGNSLLLVRLFARVNKAFGTRLPITTIFDADTVAKLSARLRLQDEIRAMVPVQTHGHLPPVFMIHSYLLYQGLSQALGRTQPFYGLRELEADNELGMPERVANYVREIRAVQPHGPYSVMGWCAAGPLTVEVARHLIEAGETMASVILFDSWLPGYLTGVESVKANGSFAPKFNGIRSKLRRHNEKMSSLSVGQRMQYMRGAAGRFLLSKRNRFFIRHWSAINVLANRFHMPLPQFMYNTTLNTFAALHAYRARPVPIRLTLIRAHDTREVPGASAACGWEQVAMHGVDVLWAPGDHETMFLGEKLEATTELVRRCLLSGELNGAPAESTPPLAHRVDGRLLHAGTL